MSENKRIISNVGIRWSGEIINKLLWFVFVIFLARNLGNTNFGYFSYIISFASMFVLFTDLGTNTFLTREVSRDNNAAGGHLVNLLGLRFIISAAVFILILLIPKTGKQWTDNGLTVALFAFALLIVGFMDLFNYTFRGLKLMSYETLVLFVWRLLLVAGGIVVIHFFYGGLQGLAWVFIISSLLGLFFAFMLAKRIIRLKTTAIKPATWPGILKSSIPLGLIVLFNGFYLKFNTILLGWMGRPEELGWYSASFRLLEGTFFIPSIFAGVVFPYFCELSKNADSKLNKIFQKSAAVILLIAASLAACLFVLSGKIIPFLFGGQFLPAVESFRIIVWSMVFIFPNELFLYFFISKGEHNKVILLMLLNAVIYTILCGLLIPLLGFIGASWIFLATQGMLFVIYLLLSAVPRRKREASP
ncbi:MAG: flippase [Elusimicrobiota bacterium]